MEQLLQQQRRRDLYLVYLYTRYRCFQSYITPENLQLVQSNLIHCQSTRPWKKHTIWHTIVVLEQDYGKNPDELAEALTALIYYNKVNLTFLKFNRSVIDPIVQLVKKGTLTRCVAHILVRMLYFEPSSTCLKELLQALDTKIFENNYVKTLKLA